MSVQKRKTVFTELFLIMHCEKNEGGTMNLILRGNYLFQEINRRVTNRDLIDIIAFLREYQEVVALDLSYNEISDCGMFNLSEFLQERPVIRHLNLVGNNIGPRGLNYLTRLGERLSLYSLRLTGNKIGDEGGKFLSELLYKKTPLKYLDLSDTHQTMTGLAYVMSSLFPSRNENSHLEYLDIGRPLPQSYHQVDDSHAAEFVGQALHENKNLKEIHLQQYQFDFRDMEILLEGLFANNTLICLDLNNNIIGDDGVDYLCKYLKTSPPLECLMLGANEIGDLGALTLSFNLPFSNIRLLDLTNNRITDEGMINIFYTIEKKTKLRALFIWGNKLTHSSLVVMERLFQTNLLDPEHTDIELYRADDELRASWNYHANRYTNRFYCEIDNESESRRTIPYNRGPPINKPVIDYKYHADNKEIGFPMCEWHWNIMQSKYFDPM